MALAYRKLQKRQDPAIHLNHFQLPTSVLSISSNASRITVVSVCYPQNTDYATICRVAHKNFQRYCQDHGYQLIFQNTTPSGLAGRDAAWGKVLALQAALSQPNVDYVFWMDGDSLFMNQDRSLEELIPSGENQLTMTGDHNCFLNSGHLMLKKGNWTENFLNKTWAMYPPPEPKAWWEQSSMIYLLSGLSPEDKDAKGCKVDVNSCCSSTPRKGCDVRPQRQMNSYLSSFGSGDFILHFAGEGGEKATLMEQYAQRVLPPAPTEAALAQLDQFHTTLHEAAREFLPDWRPGFARKKLGTRGVAASYAQDKYRSWELITYWWFWHPRILSLNLRNSFVEAPDTSSGHVAYCSQATQQLETLHVLLSAWMLKWSVDKNRLDRNILHGHPVVELCVFAGYLLWVCA